MGENFAFFLPVMMASFGLAFLSIWRWAGPATPYWSAAFFCVAAGFAVPLAAAGLPTHLWGIPADIAFSTGFLMFSQALVTRWRPGWMLRPRLAIWAGSLAICIFATLTRNLPLELIASDLGCFLLITLPLVAARPLGTHRDRLLFGAACLVALDNLVRAATVPLTLAGANGFSDSHYAFLMQAMACVFGLFLALAALAAQGLDVISRYRETAHRDALTGLYNRHGFAEAIAALPARLAGRGSVLLCDIDHFKQVNDRHGHAVGDRAIALLADILRALAPAGGIAARMGGEEFVLVLPGVHAARAADIANDIRLHFSDEAADRLALDAPLTASFGLSSLHAQDHSLDAAIARADQALYEAKRSGRNRLCARHLAVSEDTVEERGRRRA